MFQRHLLIIRVKEGNRERLEGEYQRLLDGILGDISSCANIIDEPLSLFIITTGLRQTSENRSTDVITANPILPDEILQEAVPGNIRKAEHFIAFLRRFVEFLTVSRKEITLCYLLLKHEYPTPTQDAS